MVKTKIFLIVILVLGLGVCGVAGWQLFQKDTLPVVHGDKVLPLQEVNDAQLSELEADLAKKAEERADFGTPGADEMTMEQALEASHKAMNESQGLTAEMLTQYSVSPIFSVENGSVNINGSPVFLSPPYWQMTYMDKNGSAVYTVYLDAKTGEVLAVAVPEDTNG